MFIVGQRVICCDDKAPMWIRQLYTQWIQEGVTYTVRDLAVGVSFPDEEGGKPVEGEICVYLVGVSNPKSLKEPFRERGFNAMRFKPLQELTEAQIMHGVEGEKVQELEPALSSN